MFKLALIQMKVVGGDITYNIDNAVAHISKAAENDAEVVLLPEAMDYGWTHSSAMESAEPIDNSRIVKTMSDAAKRHGIYICFGFSERAGDKVFNAAALINPKGNIIAHHRKLNELKIAHNVYDQGDLLCVVETPLATFGLMICADGFANDFVISKTLAYMGADVILSPCSWAVAKDWDNEKTPYGDTWRKCYMPVAKEYGVWIAGASNVGEISNGPWAGRPCIGCSTVVNADGEEVIQGPFGVDAQSILYVDIEPTPRPTRGMGWDPVLGKE